MNPVFDFPLAALAAMKYVPTRLEINSLSKVIISNIDPSSETKFFIQLLDDTLNFDLVMKLINSKPLKSLESISCLQPGIPCLIRNPIDGIIYRATVISFNENYAQVFAVDTGQILTIDFNNIGSLDESASKIHSIAIHCQLHDLKTNIDYASNVFTRYMNLVPLIAKVVSYSNYCYSLELIDTSFEINLSILRLINLGSNYIPTVQLDDQLNSPLPLYIEIERPIMDTSAFFAFIKETFHNEKKAMFKKRLDLTYQKLSINILLNPKIGDYCVVDLDHGNFERSKILEVGSGFTILEFIDIGSFGKVPLNKIKVLIPELSIVSQFGIICQFYDPKIQSLYMANFSKAIGSNFKGHIVNAIQLANRCKCFMLNISDSVESSIFIDGLKGSTFIKSSIMQPIEMKVLNNNWPKSTGIIPNQWMDCNLSHIESPSSFFVQLTNDLPKMQQLIMNVNQQAAVMANVDKILLGMALLAQYKEDGNWYRALVVGLMKAQVKVLFIDYGNTEIYDLDGTIFKQINNPSTWAPPFAYECCLDGIKQNNYNDDFLWSSEEKQKFFNLITGERFSLLWQPDRLSIYDQLPLVHLLHRKDSLNIHFLSLFGKLDPEYQIPIESIIGPISKTILKSPSPSQHRRPSENLVSIQKSISPYYDIIKLTKSERNEAFICHIINHADFWCHLNSESQLLEEEMEKMRNFYDSPNGTKFNFIENPKPKEPCIARFSEDDQWYRAEVLQFEDSDKIKIKFVDYGNDEVISIDENNLKIIRPEFIILKKQAIHCCLDNAGYVNKETDLDYFQSAVIDKKIIITINDIKSDVNGDNLYIVNVEIDGVILDLSNSRKHLFVNNYPEVLNSKTNGDIKFEKEQFSNEDINSNKDHESSHKKNDYQQHNTKFNKNNEFDNSNNKSFLLACSNADFQNGHVEKVCDNQKSELSTARRDFDREDFNNERSQEFAPTQGFKRKQFNNNRERNLNRNDDHNKCIIRDSDFNHQNEKSDWGKRTNGNGNENRSQGFNVKKISQDTDQRHHDYKYKSNFNYDRNEDCKSLSYSENNQKRLNKNENGTKNGFGKGNSFRRDEEENQGFISRQDTKSSEGFNRAFKSDAPAIEKFDKFLGPFTEKYFAIGSKMEAVNSQTISPSDFYMQQLDPIGFQNLVKVVNISCIKFLNDPEAKVNNVKVGLPCAALDQDNSWYRAQIIAIKNDKIKIKFVDYGNTNIISSNKLLYLEKSLGRIELKTLRCCLKGAKLEQKWTKEQINLFVQLLVGTSKCIFVSKLDDRFIVEIINEKSENVNNKLLLDSIKPLAYKKGIMPTIGSNISMDVVYITKDCLIYCQSNTLLIDLDKQLIRLNEVYNLKENNLSIKDLIIGSACVAKFSDDGNWYRATVESISNDDITVKFIDYGNSDTVTIKNVNIIDHEFLELPICAIKCKLYNLFFTETFVYEKLNDLILGKSIDCNIVAFGDDVYTINACCENNDVLEQIKSCDEYKNIKLPLIIQDANKLEIGYSFAASVRFIDEDGIIFFQDLSNLDELQLLMDEIKEYCAKQEHDSQFVEKLKIGDYCLAKFLADESWYRAQVVDKEINGIQILFVDYGNKELINSNEILSLDEKFVKQTKFAYTAILKDNNEQKFTLYNELADLIFEKNISIMITGHDDKNMLIQIFDESNQDIINDLKKSCNFVSPAESKMKDTSMKMIKYLKPALKPNLNLKITGFISCIDISGSIYIQDTNLISKLESLMEELNKYYCNTNLTHIEEKFLLPKMACTVKYVDDDKWYRGEIMTINNTSIQVDFVDYGNYDDYTIDNIFLLDKLFLIEPKFCFVCQLYSQDALNEELMSSLINTIMGEQVSLEIVSIEGDEVKVNIFDIEGKNILDSLKELDPNINNILEILPATTVETLSSMTTDDLFENFKVPNQLNKKVSCSADVIYIDGEGILYLQLSDSTDALDLLMNKLNIFYNNESNKLNINEPSLQACCCAKYEADGNWYRGRIINILDDQIEVYFVDFGNSDHCKKEDVKLLDISFMEQPVYIHKAKLNRLKNYDVDTLDLLDANFLGQKIEFEVISYENEICMIEEKMSTVIGTLPNQNKQQENLEFLIIPQQIIPTDRYQVMISDMNKVDLIAYVQLVRNGVQMEAMLDCLDELCSLPQPTNDPTDVKYISCIKYHETWHRANIIESRDDGTCLVRLVDLGKILNVNHDQFVKVIDEKISKIPAFAIKCNIKIPENLSANDGDILKVLDNLSSNLIQTAEISKYEDHYQIKFLEDHLIVKESGNIIKNGNLSSVDNQANNSSLIEDRLCTFVSTIDMNIGCSESTEGRTNLITIENHDLSSNPNSLIKDRLERMQSIADENHSISEIANSISLVEDSLCAFIITSDSDINPKNYSESAEEVNVMHSSEDDSLNISQVAHSTSHVECKLCTFVSNNDADLVATLNTEYIEEMSGSKNDESHYISVMDTISSSEPDGLDIDHEHLIEKSKELIDSISLNQLGNNHKLEQFCTDNIFNVSDDEGLSIDELSDLLNIAIDKEILEKAFNPNDLEDIDATKYISMDEIENDSFAHENLEDNFVAEMKNEIFKNSEIDTSVQNPNTDSFGNSLDKCIVAVGSIEEQVAIIKSRIDADNPGVKGETLIDNPLPETSNVFKSEIGASAGSLMMTINKLHYSDDIDATNKDFNEQVTKLNKEDLLGDKIKDKISISAFVENLSPSEVNTSYLAEKEYLGANH